MDKPLRRNGAFGGFIALASMIMDMQTLAFEHRVRDSCKVLGSASPSGHTQDAYSLFDPALARLPGLQYLLYPFTKRRDMAFEQTGLGFGQQLLDGQEGVEFRGVEP